MMSLTQARERWEGSAGGLLEELCEIQGIDMKPEALGKELQKYREPLYNQDHIFFQWRKSNGRRVLPHGVLAGQQIQCCTG